MPKPNPQDTDLGLRSGSEGLNPNPGPGPDPEPPDPDTTPPTLTVSAPATVDLAQAKQVRVTGRAADPFVKGQDHSGIAWVACSRDGTSYPVVQNPDWLNWYVDVPLPSVGAHNITISSSDNAENQTSRTVTVTAVDSTPPVLLMSGPQDNASGGFATGDVKVTMRGTADDPESGVASIQCTLDGASKPISLSGRDWTADVDLPENVPPQGKTYNITVTCKNGANADATSQVKNVLARDTTPPDLRILEPTRDSIEVLGAETGADVLLRGEVWGETPDKRDGTKLYSGIKSVQLNVDDGPYTPADLLVPGDLSRWQKLVHIPAMGTHKVSVLCTDNAGNSTSREVKVTVILPYESSDPKDPLSSLAYLGDLLDFAENRAKIKRAGGLRGEYYDNQDFTNLKFTRVDGTVDFDWGGGSPDQSIQPDTFSVRWTGLVQPRFSGTYTFYAVSDDGIRLWVNGEKIIDRWQAPTELPSTTVYLEKDHLYDIKLEYYENMGGATIKLSWSSDSGQVKEIVPSGRLYYLDPVDRKLLTRAFYQRFESLVSASSKEANSRQVRQVRLCAEVLRKLLATQPADTVAHWGFDEGTGDAVTDSSGNGNVGTLQGPTRVAGKVGTGALAFDGANDMVGVASSESLRGVTNDSTVAFWANPQATHEIDPEGTTGTGGVQGQRYAIGPEQGGIAYGSPDHAGAGVSIGTNGISVYEYSDSYMPAPLVHQAPVSGWTHVTVVYENGQPRLYVNGTLVRTGLKSPKKYVHANPAGLGGMAYGYFQGQLDDVRIYDRVLSKEEISGLVASQGDMVWIEDALPAGARPSGAGDGWTWVNANPTPFSGAAAHQSNVVAGMHQHYFDKATAALDINPGDRLFAYVYLDPTNPPSEVMLQWNDGTGWEHRAYWGADKIQWGTKDTESRRFMGALPTTGQWVRLEVPASQVGLEGKMVSGMAFTLFDGRATWDRAGKTSYVPNPPYIADLAEAEARYRQAAYQTLLSKLGTSYEEIRLARTADDATRNSLAEGLGIDLAPTRPDQLDGLFLPPDKVTESTLEKLFGLASTTGGSPVDGSEYDLLTWRLAHLRTLWKQQDYAEATGDQNPSPIIDPDLIDENDLKDAVKGNPAYDLWDERRKWVAGKLEEIKGKREATATQIDGFNSIVAAYVCPVQELLDLEDQRKNGKDIEPELANRQLDLQAFSYLMRVRNLALTGTVLPEEWDDVYSILVQVQKLRNFESWRDAEKQKDLALEPNYFEIPVADPTLPPPPPKELPAWRASNRARRDWQGTLQARLDQRLGVVQDLQAVVDSTEEVTLPQLRDALVDAIGVVYPGSGLKERLTERLQIDVRDSGYRKTSPIDQAVETVRGVLFSLRTGRFQEADDRLDTARISDWMLEVNESYEEGDFDDEWTWMGSYDAWRAAMSAFLYPENLLLPTLRQQEDMVPGSGNAKAPFEVLVDELRKDQPLTPKKARDAADAYLTSLRALKPQLLTTLDQLSDRYASKPFELTDQLSEGELSSRASIIRDYFAGTTNPNDAPTEAKELLYFVPMQLALQLEQSGEHLAALDWFQTVYAYDLPAAERKVYYGLELEKNVQTDYRRPVEWLLDYFNPQGQTRWRSNPHENARFRRYAYTRFTMLSLVRCFLGFADAEFTRDTAESLPRARALYMSALDLLDLDEMQPDPSSPFPPNPVPQSLRLHAELNLSKLRNGRNIAGMQRQVEPVAPRTQTDGLPILSRNGQLAAPGAVPLRPTPYHYSVLVERAKQLVGLAQQIEAAFLAAIEKRDQENYRLLEAGRDLDLAQANIKLQDLRVGEAVGGVTLAERQKERAQIQADYYQQLLNKGMNDLEEASLVMYGAAAGLQLASAAVSFAAAFLPASISVGFPEGVSTSASPQGSASAIASSLSSGAAAVSTTASITSTLASYERRKQEWEQQKSVANKDIQIGDQQVVLAQYHTSIAEQERVVAGMQAEHAKAVANFLANKFTSAELYEWMSGVLSQVYSYFLQQATAMAQLAQSQLAFERQEASPSYIKVDYWQPPSEVGASDGSDGKTPDRRGLTGSARLLQDVYQLDQYAFETNKRKLQLSHTFSLAQLAPFEFQRFRETGKLPFATPMELFDSAFPGHYLRLISRVRTSVIALIPPTQGIKATLTTSGISRVVVGGDAFQTAVVRREPELVALSSPSNATGISELDPQSEMLRPFEAMGVDTSWELEMPKAANPFDYRTIADVLVTIEYTALNDFNYRQQVTQALKPDISANAQFSFRQQFADQWYDLNNPEGPAVPTVRFTTTRDDFPPNIEGLKIERLMLYFDRTDGVSSEVKILHLLLGTETAIGAATSDSGVISTRSASGVPTGEWELAFDGEQAKNMFKNGEIEDILFVITYSGTTPEWPA